MTTLLDFIFQLSPLIHIFNSFLEHDSTTIRNISMVLGRFITWSLWSVSCKNNNSALLHFLIISPHPYFNSFPEHNPETIRNISMILGGFIETG